MTKERLTELREEMLREAQMLSGQAMMAQGAIVLLDKILAEEAKVSGPRDDKTDTSTK